ncbi:hypothetical protein [Streptomyces antibioticus]|uniref:hypothetical protein n=1 Tax=Streptomyces antibioticus TaxID=1890 RepID=UPI0033DBF53E
MPGFRGDLGLTQRAPDELRADPRRQPVGQQDLLDRGLTLQCLVDTAPGPAHTALADQRDQPVPTAHQAPLVRRHGRQT